MPRQRQRGALRGLALLAAAAGPAFVNTGAGRARDAGLSPRDQSAVRVRFFDSGPSPEEIARRKAAEENAKRSELVRKYAPIAGIVLAGGAVLLGSKKSDSPSKPSSAPASSAASAPATSSIPEPPPKPTKAEEIKAGDKYKAEQAKKRMEYEQKKKADQLAKGEAAKALRKAEEDKRKAKEDAKKAKKKAKKDGVEAKKDGVE